jgi:general nucleoside transport system permease protein
MSEKDDRFSQAFKEILAGGLTRTLLASSCWAFLVGAIFMIAIEQGVHRQSMGYFVLEADRCFGRCLERGLKWVWSTVQGCDFQPRCRQLLKRRFSPITETLETGSAPLIAAGLGIGLTFRVGLFNIGGTGQLIFRNHLCNLGCHPNGAPIRDSHARGGDCCNLSGATSLGSSGGIPKGPYRSS